MPPTPRLSIPKKLIVVAFTVGGLAGCPHDDEPACTYICNSDAAVEISNSDASPDPHHVIGFTTDGGEECHYTFC